MAAVNGKKGRGKRRLMGDINVVPYIDVMLVLLIIFMVTAPLLSQGVEVDLPQASAEPLPTPNEQVEPIVLTVDANGSFYLNIGENPKAALADKQVVAIVRSVMKNRPETPVAVRGDQNVAYGAIMQAMVLLQEAGAPKVGMVTEPRDDAESSN